MRHFLLFIPIVMILLAIFQGTAYCTSDPYIISSEAVKLYKSGRLSEAINKAQQALSIYEKSLGPQHPNVATTLDILTRLYIDIGDYAKAKELCERALSIQEKTVPKSQAIITSLILLSEVYIANWEMSKAEMLLQRALVLNEKNFGSQNRDTAIILNNLGMLYSSQAHYDKAEAAFQRALNINEKLGTDQIEISTNLQNLGKLYSDLGTSAKAEPLIKRAILIREKVLGPDHPRIASTLDLLAAIYRQEGDYAKALQLGKRSVAIAESKLDPWHPLLAIHLGNLGQFYFDMGDYDNAETYCLRALTIKERTQGPNHPGVASSKANLAMLYIKMGEMAKAESFYRQALAIDEKIMGANHPIVALILKNMAFSLVAQKKLDQALLNMQRVVLIENDLLDQVMGFTSESQKLAFLAKLNYNLDFFLTLVLTQEQVNPIARNNAYALWLKRKGAALEAQRQFRQALIQSGNPEGKALFERLSKLCAELTKLTYMEPKRGEAEAYHARLTELKKEQSDVEANLAKCSRNYARDQKRGQIDVTTVARTLPEGSVLVDFAKINIFDFNATDPQQKWKSPHYIVFILPAGSSDRLNLIDLGEAEPIEQAIASLRAALQNVQDPEAINKSAGTLHKLIFSPMEAGIGNAKNIFISPDGVLNLVPFEILRDAHNRPLIETYTFNYVCSGRDLVGMGEIPTATGRSLVLGDPDFDLGARAPSGNSNQPVQAFQSSYDLQTLTFNPIPATRVEAKAVAKIIGDNPRLRVGAEAVEGELQKGPAPRYLHLATHGFFLSDQEMQETVNSRGPEGLSQFSSFLKATSSPAQHYENPLARSGVALAGARTALKGKGSHGIVTAEKFLTMPISGTEIVVLSACQTGLGDVKTGEGVFGLRRAITQAGAKGMVMSMWSVPDQETKELMEFFYVNLAKGMPKAQALRQAALDERAIVIKRFDVDNPVFWGAFIYIGDK